MTDGTHETEENAEVSASELKHLVSCDELREICELTIKLTELRQNECKHLCVENFATELFSRLLQELSMNKQGMVRYYGSDPVFDEATRLAQ